MINIILPTYNEAENIGAMLKMLKFTLERMNVEHLIIVVDDNSSDGTAKIIKNKGTKNIKIIERAGKLGLGSAYVEGLKHCFYEYTILLDADLQHDPYNIPLMYSTAMSFKEIDIVSGTRYADAGMVCNWSFFRKLTSAGANTLAQYVLGLKATDCTGSYRCYKTSALKELIPHIKCKNFGFQMEVIARAEQAGKKIKEVPIIFFDRSAGESKMTLKEIFLFIKTVLLLFFIL